MHTILRHTNHRQMFEKTTCCKKKKKLHSFLVYTSFKRFVQSANPSPLCSSIIFFSGLQYLCFQKKQSLFYPFQKFQDYY